MEGIMDNFHRSHYRGSLSPEPDKLTIPKQLEGSQASKAYWPASKHLLKVNCLNFVSKNYPRKVPAAIFINFELLTPGVY